LAVRELSLGRDGITYTLAARAGAHVTVNGASPAAESKGAYTEYAGVVGYGGGKLTVVVEKGSFKKTISIYVGKKPALLNGFDADADLDAVEISVRGSVKSVNTNPAYALTGNSLKADLKGWVDPLNPNNTLLYRPFVNFDIPDISDAQYVEFEVYNAGEDLTVSVNVSDANDVSYGLDTVTLKGGAWTTVRVGNFLLISTDKARLSRMTRIGLSVTKNLLNGNAPYTHTLYIDNAYIAEK
jgi:hypothetical protein